MNRTHYCGRLTEKEMGSKISLAGWVQTKRDMGGVIFIDLRDREGTLQVVFNASNLTEEEFHIAETLRNQSVIEVSGLLRRRDEETYNPKLPTGTIELAAESIKLLSTCTSLPYNMDDRNKVREDLRLKYRFLDLRSPEMVRNLKFRHQLTKVVRDYLDNDDFIEVETPYLTKSTPEGARDYLVPSRVHPGTFYALPQSPQIFKQLLMVGGFDKYYQVARCFRDEDLRADRQPEFTQVDMELSFVEQEDIFIHLEKLFKHIMKELMHEEITEPFERMTWHTAMDVYGSDKPDLRFELPIVDITDIAGKCSFTVFNKVVKSGGIVRAINVPGGDSFTRSQIEELTEKALSYGAGGMAWISIRPDGELYSVLTKYFEPELMQELIERVNAKEGDFILFCADKLSTVRRTLGGLRLDIADMLHLRRDEYKFLFVTDFPEFEYSEEEKRWVATHHPFTMPYEEDIEFLRTDPGRVRAQAYDVVLNGTELGSGSIRIHRPDVQQAMFEALGFSDEEIEERFGFMVNAFRYGTPPHGGFAFGLDRLTMLLLKADSLRDVIAFPKVKDASCPLTDAPNTVDTEQLEVLNLAEAFKAPELSDGKAAKKKMKPQIDIQNVANLARLSLTKEEMTEMPSQMQSIIAFADKLSELDIEDVKPTAHVVEQTNVMREDIPRSDYSRAEMLMNAPTHTEEYIYVPKAFE
ncbi:MAG: aspartate--tRNA ligase [Clostridia bacterium]|nr:aspartate--tRNA ligase [Clostridia bacterium]